jgi:hypothetical protein
MSSTDPGTARGPAVSPARRSSTGDDWAATAADGIERVVGSVKSKTTEPLDKLARALVYGLVGAIVGVAVAVMGAVALVRLVDILVPGDVWAAHLIVGGIFTVVGLFLWRKRSVKTVKV